MLPSRPSASPLRFVIIAGRPTYPSFKRPSAIELFRSGSRGTLCRRTSCRHRHWLFCRKRLKTYLFSRSFPRSTVVPAQRLCHFDQWLKCNRTRGDADGKAAKAELAFQKGQIKDAFSNFRNLKASFCHISTPILDNNGNLVSNKKGKLARWNEYYSQLLNRQPVPPSAELEDEAKVAEPYPLIDCNEKLCGSSCNSTQKVGKQQSCCNIPAELLKYGGSSCNGWLTRIFQVWRTGTKAEDWKNGIVLPFYKGKGSRKNARVTALQGNHSLVCAWESFRPRSI